VKLATLTFLREGAEAASRVLGPGKQDLMGKVFRNAQFLERASKRLEAAGFQS